MSEREPFFGQRFWQDLLIAWSGRIVLMLILLGGVWWAKSTFDGVMADIKATLGTATVALDAANESLSAASESMEAALEIVKAAPESIQGLGTAIKDTAGETGDALGEGAANAIERAGSAWDEFRKPEEPTE